MRFATIRKSLSQLYVQVLIGIVAGELSRVSASSSPYPQPASR